MRIVMQGVKTKPRLEPKNHLSHFWHSSNTPFVVGKSGKPYSTIVCMYVHVDIRCMGTVHRERERALPHSLPPFYLFSYHRKPHDRSLKTLQPLSPSLPLPPSLSCPEKSFTRLFAKKASSLALAHTSGIS